MAKLIEGLALSGSRKSDGSPNASGKVWAYVTGTSTAATLYDDRTGDTVASQPVILDAAGKATIYVNQAVTLRVETSAGVSLGEIDYQDAPGVVGVQNDGFTGTLEDGSQGAGGETDLDAVLTSALTSFGGADFRYLDSAGATSMGVAAWMSQVWVNVKAFGAVGDGTHNDFTAIQAATNRAIALTGGNVFFPPGTYLHSAVITNTSAYPVSFRGVRGVSTLKNTNTSTGTFTISGSGGYDICDLYIDHSTGSTGAAITLSSAFDVSIHDIEIRKHAIGISSGASIQELDIRRAYIDPVVGATGRAIRLTGATNNITIRDSRLYATSGTAIELQAATYGAGVAISGNMINAATGILASSAAVSQGALAIFGNSIAATTKKISLTGAPIAPMWQWGNGIDSQTTTVTVDTTLTPDWTDGPIYRVNVTGAGKTVTFNPPTPSPSVRGTRMHFRLYNNNAGVTTYVILFALASAAISTTNGVTTEWGLEYDTDRGVWVEIYRTTHL